MMAKSLLIRPQLVALYACHGQSVFFNTCSFSPKPYCSIPHVSLSTQSCGLRSRFRCRSNQVAIAPGFRSLTVRASTHVNEPGSIDSPLMQSMQNKIKEQLNAESVTVVDASGDGRHVCIDVIASAFEGQSSVNRQRMVYKAIWEELQNTVHAVDQMTTKTPTEAAAS